MLSSSTQFSTIDAKGTFALFTFLILHILIYVFQFMCELNMTPRKLNSKIKYDT